MLYNVGDRVKLVKDSVYINQSGGAGGVIYNIDSESDWCYDVLWSNDRDSGNCYREQDLELEVMSMNIEDWL